MLHLRYSCPWHDIISQVGVFRHEGGFVSVSFVHKELVVSREWVHEWQQFVIERVIYQIVDVGEWIRILGESLVKLGVIYIPPPIF